VIDKHAVALNPELLTLARKTGAELAESERSALLARAEYHTAVRRLHLAGASLREIADALAMSHQRVHQIVDESGGSWWRKAWRTRGTTRDAVCTWCNRPPSEVAKLVAGPNIYICDGCVREAERALRKGEDGRAGARVSRCSFCRRFAGTRRKVVTGRHANVCADCLQMCRDFMLLGEASG
jgi:hypothetical protein